LRKPALALVSAGLLAAGSDPPAAPLSVAPPRPAPQSAPLQRPVPPRQAPPGDGLPPVARQINLATLPPPVPNAPPNAPLNARPGPRVLAFDPVLVRAQVLLDRARFSPGAIDGRNGGNFGEALRAYQGAVGLVPTGALDPATFAALTRNDGGPVVQLYVIGPRDEAGPFIGKRPHGFKAQARLRSLGYLDPAQELAERFHMSVRLIRTLNPRIDFRRPGTAILVTVPNPAPLAAPVGVVEVDKSRRAVRAYDPAGRLLAAFPATVGSRERPAPSGVLKVRGVAQHPTYTWDPRRLTFGPRGRHAHRLTIAPGPSNPVGVVWIALSRTSYGIHGAPDPDSVGRRQSHGCIRLTNWDAELLSRAVRPGVKVVFVGRDANVRAT